MTSGIRAVAAALAAAAAMTSLAACGGGSSSNSTADWKKKNGAVVAAFSKDLSDAITNISQGSRDNTVGSCQQVSDDSADVRKTLPVPDKAVDTALRTALTSGTQAAADCIKGARNTDAKAVEAGQREFADARKAMDMVDSGVAAFA